jgi:hypothetical protein
MYVRGIAKYVGGEGLFYADNEEMKKRKKLNVIAKE